MRAPRLALLLLAFSSAALPASAAMRTLVPHRAVYDLSLDEASDRSGITGISGRMVYEFNGSPCEGYTVTFRFVTRISTGETSRVTDQQTTTFEDGDGKSFNFVTRTFVDQSPEREIKGVARLDAKGVTVKLDKPEHQTIDLDRTQFPTQHLKELIGKANAGETFYETSLFDGSEDADRIMTTTIVIGKEENAEKTDPELVAMKSFAKDPYWPVEIAYFDLSEGEEMPSYRISFKLHDSGITRDLTMDYGDFSITGRLVDLALFDTQADSCSH